MSFMKTIRFKPKPENLDKMVEQFAEVTRKAMKPGSIDAYFTAIIEKEIIYVGIFNEQEESTDIIGKGLEWLNTRKDLLEKYSDSNDFALVETGPIKERGSNI